MSLSDPQWLFLQDVARLILWAEDHGYKLTGGDLYRDPRCPYGSKRSQHHKRLAVDLNLFRRFVRDENGVWIPWERTTMEKWEREVYVTATRHHRPLGEYWESLSPYNRWGGRFGDGNHYERQERPR